MGDLIIIAVQVSGHQSACDVKHDLGEVVSELIFCGGLLIDIIQVIPVCQLRHMLYGLLYGFIFCIIILRPMIVFALLIDTVKPRQHCARIFAQDNTGVVEPGKIAVPVKQIEQCEA